MCIDEFTLTRCDRIVTAKRTPSTGLIRSARLYMATSRIVRTIG